VRRFGSLEAMLADGRFAAQADELRLYRAIATMDAKAPLPPLADQTPTWEPRCGPWRNRGELKRWPSGLAELGEGRMKTGRQRAGSWSQALRIRSQDQTLRPLPLSLWRAATLVSYKSTAKYFSLSYCMRIVAVLCLRMSSLMRGAVRRRS